MFDEILGDVLVGTLTGKAPKTVAQLVKLKAVKEMGVGRAVVESTLETLVGRGTLQATSGAKPKYGVPGTVVVSPKKASAAKLADVVEECIERKLGPIRQRLDEILAMLGRSSTVLEKEVSPPAARVQAGEILCVIDQLDMSRNCHNLVPLPWLFEAFHGRLDRESFHSMIRELARRDVLDLQCCSDRSILTPEERALGIEDPYRGLLYYVGRKVP